VLYKFTLYLLTYLTLSYDNPPKNLIVKMIVKYFVYQAPGVLWSLSICQALGIKPSTG